MVPFGFDEEGDVVQTFVVEQVIGEADFMDAGDKDIDFLSEFSLGALEEGFSDFHVTAWQTPLVGTVGACSQA